MTETSKKIARDEYDNIILVVEEDKGLREHILSLLNENFPNCTVLTCNNGLDALKTLKKGHAHIVITEWDMKPMSGINLLKALRFQFTRETLPIMMLTVSMGKEDLYEFYSHEGNFFVKKPFEESDFLAKVEKMLLLKTMVKMISDLSSIKKKTDAIQTIFEKCIVTGVADEHTKERIEETKTTLDEITSFSEEILKKIEEKTKEDAKKEQVLV